MKLMPQLAFGGRCREAFAFYADLLDGRVTATNTFGGEGEHALPPGSTPSRPDHIRFAAIAFGDQLLTGNDLPADQYEPMRGFNVALHLDKAADARRIFDGLAEGGEVTTPLSRVDWADQFGMVRDRFGVPWLVLGFER
jgi:PhnB protein